MHLLNLGQLFSESSSGWRTVCGTRKTRYRPRNTSPKLTRRCKASLHEVWRAALIFKVERQFQPPFGRWRLSPPVLSSISRGWLRRVFDVLHPTNLLKVHSDLVIPPSPCSRSTSLRKVPEAFWDVDVVACRCFICSWRIEQIAGILHLFPPGIGATSGQYVTVVQDCHLSDRQVRYGPRHVPQQASLLLH